MNNNATLGWDIGGAHLKAVLVSSDGRALHAWQRACPLWRGIDQLKQAAFSIMGELAARPSCHAITMTGELADIFPSREAGVLQLTQGMCEWLPGEKVVYAGRAGFISPEQAVAHVNDIASANWYASAEFLSCLQPSALFIDIGSTTCDIIPLLDGMPAARGYSDAERLRTGELVYTGVVRTPVMAVAQRLPFAGEWHGVAAEHFATMADVYRLTGELNEAVDMVDTADGQGKSPPESARRLARMIGCDFSDGSLLQWQQLAKSVRSEQLRTLQCAIERQLSRLSLAGDTPFIAAGAGAFLIRELARTMEHAFIDAGSLVQGEGDVTHWAEVCLPAYSVAWLQARRAA